jgi:hypothetical protein
MLDGEIIIPARKSSRSNAESGKSNNPSNFHGARNVSERVRVRVRVRVRSSREIGRR